MSDERTGGPAYPDQGQADYTGGLTMLDHFAGLAMQAIIESEGAAGSVEYAVSKAYQYAAAMIAERARLDKFDTFNQATQP